VVKLSELELNIKCRSLEQAVGTEVYGRVSAAASFRLARIGPDLCSTRYRDLLLSTTQITALHSSSLRLSSSLQAIGKACANPEGSQPVPESGAASVDGGAEASASGKPIIRGISPNHCRCSRTASPRGTHEVTPGRSGE
jgi:hypothetical protein